jgi:hypothetical protein
MNALPLTRHAADGAMEPCAPRLMSDVGRTPARYCCEDTLENARGDIVTYVVGGTGQQGHGYGAYIPRDVVESGRRKLGAE